MSDDRLNVCEGDTWILAMGDILRVTEIQYYFCSQIQEFCVKGYINEGRFSSWKLTGESSIGSHYNMICLKSRVASQQTDNRDSRQFFVDVMTEDPSKMHDKWLEIARRK